MKKYSISVTKELFKKLQDFYDAQQVAKEEYFNRINAIENEMQMRVGLDYEFFWVDGEIVGIGRSDRKIRLINSHEFEEGKIGYNDQGNLIQEEDND